MQCPSCNAQIDSGKFCPVCGKAVDAAAAAASLPVEAPEPSDQLAGQTLGGKYKVVKLLGEGGMGAVYQGEQTLGTKIRKVAIKTLHTHLSKDPKILARFEREVGTVAELEHPNTIQVYDFGKAEPSGALYIVMEFIQGTNLAEQIEKNGAMDPVRVEKIMSQICGSLEEAHGRGIVHRDLKPDNIVLTERAGQKDFVKVLDFGIAKRSNEEDKNEQKLTQQGMVLGTPPYMSPEQFTGKPIDARSDIYSLAIMAYEMLTANLPFNANTAWEWATQHMTAPPRDIDTMPNHEKIPPRMKEALRKALSKSPDDRYPNVRAFFDAFSGATPIVAAPAIAAAAPSGGKGKTEVGTPLDFSGAAMGSYGSNPGSYGSNPGPMSPAPGQMGQAGTQGNVAFPTPGTGVPQAPPNAHAQRAASGGGNKGMLLGIAAVVGLASVGAVVFALRGHSTPSAGGLDLGAIDAGSSSTPFDLTADSGALAAPTFDAAIPGLAPLQNGTTPVGPSHPAHHGDAGGGKGGTTPVTPPGPTVTPPAAGEPIECVKARLMRAAGNVAAFQTLEKQCVAKGGHI